MSAVEADILPVSYYRILDPLTDEQLYTITWNWQTDYPDWLKDTDPLRDRRSFLEDARSGRQLDLGIWHCNEFVAVASFFERELSHYEMTVWANREARASWLAPGIWEIGNALFEDGVEEIYCVLARFHTANRRLAQRCWMQFNGTRRLARTAKGRIVEWMVYSIDRDQWIKRRESKTENHLERVEQY